MLQSARTSIRWDQRLRTEIESRLEGWGHLAYRRRWWVVAGMALLAFALASPLPLLRFETSTEALLHENDPARIVYDEFRELFGREEAIIVAVHSEQVFSRTFLARLRELHDVLEEEVPHLEEITSLINVRHTRGEADKLIVAPLLEKWPTSEEELSSLREVVLASPLYRNYLISRDGDTTSLIIKMSAYSSTSEAFDSLEDELAGFESEPGTLETAPLPAITGEEMNAVARAVAEIVGEFDAPGFEVHVAGAPTMSLRIHEEMRFNIAIFSGLSILVVSLLLFVLLRRLSAVFLTLIIITASILSTFGVMAALDRPLGVPTQILPSFLLAVGVGGAVHLLVIFYQRYDAGSSKESAIAYALEHSGLAVIMTGLTTAGGLISFVVAPIAPVADLGLFAPLGIILGLMYCIVLLPAALAVCPVRRRPVLAERNRNGWTQRVLLWTGDRCVERPWTVVCCMSLILIVSLVGVSRLQFHYDPLSWFPEDEPVRLDTDFVDRELEGNVSLEFLLNTGRENGVQDAAFLANLERATARIEALDSRDSVRAGKTISIADMMKEIHQALNENRPGFDVIPKDDALVAQELLLFENSGSDDLQEVVDSSFQRARFSLILPHVPPLLFVDYIETVSDILESELGSEIEVTATGFVTLITRALQSITISMLRSYGVALMIITPLMFLLLGTLRGGAAAMVPNLAPIILTLGLMGWTGIPMDIFTLLIGSIAIGLAVDDTIHFMHGYRKYFEESNDVRWSVRETLKTTGHALLTTSVVLSLAFFIYMFASMQNLVDFGLLTGFTIITAFVADITVSPALMALSAPRLRRRTDAIRVVQPREVDPEAIAPGGTLQS